MIMTARGYAEIVVSEMNDEDITGIVQQGSAEHWQDGIGLMLTGGEGFEASDVVREIESLLDTHRRETRSITQPDETMVQALRDLAVEQQDQHLVQLCDRALVQGDPEAVADCKRIFHDAFALVEEQRLHAERLRDVVEQVLMASALLDDARTEFECRTSFWLSRFARIYPDLAPYAIYDAVLAELRRRQS